MYILGHPVFLIRQTTVKLPSRCVSADTALPVLWLFSGLMSQHGLHLLGQQSALRLKAFDISSWKIDSVLMDLIVSFNRHLSNMQTDKCLEVSHGWGSHESDVVYVIVLCSVPPEKTTWWSACVTSVFLRWDQNNWSCFRAEPSYVVLQSGVCIECRLSLRHKLQH